ncbi:hypothetical protein K4L44_01995 [Halosquirtibacter laminarini]|uniref:Uncharacterized protein n=1 Tax=Halosquirtibacter laminarini TaxID=3374600 RepID=A0AC61NGA1_9BACT|nr:hypothetical protein K4L44_01995 [Prolixibacteraceae bacterium]
MAKNENKKILHEEHHHIEIPHHERLHLDQMFLKKPIYTVSLIIGIILLTLEIILAHITFIPLILRVLLFLLPSMFILMLIRDKVHKHVNTKKEKWIHLGMLYIGIGALIMSLFTGINYFFREKTIQTKRVTIVHKKVDTIDEHSLKLVTIEYQGVEKELLVKSDRIYQSNTLEIKIQNGLLGYAVLKSHEK